MTTESKAVALAIEKLTKVKMQNMELREERKALRIKLAEYRARANHWIVKCPQCQSEKDLVETKIKCSSCGARMEKLNVESSFDVENVENSENVVNSISERKTALSTSDISVESGASISNS